VCAVYNVRFACVVSSNEESPSIAFEGAFGRHRTVVAVLAGKNYRPKL
jgi:hypothetical protein